MLDTKFEPADCWAGRERTRLLNFTATEESEQRSLAALLRCVVRGGTAVLTINGELSPTQINFPGASQLTGAYAAPQAKNRFQHHIPGFIDAEPDPPVEFTTLEQLLAIPRVAGWMKYDWFGRFSYLPNPGDMRGGDLMVESMDRTKWYVVGCLDQDVDGLPRFATAKDFK